MELGETLGSLHTHDVWQINRHGYFMENLVVFSYEYQVKVVILPH